MTPSCPYQTLLPSPSSVPMVYVGLGAIRQAGDATGVPLCQSVAGFLVRMTRLTQHLPVGRDIEILGLRRRHTGIHFSVKMAMERPVDGIPHFNSDGPCCELPSHHESETSR
ncbi:hypothetical protein CH063_14885 [Colletotrichum higginsianum]|uniref:Uncharacterized protein n=1 Tax=Colletotrichum higginsianum (strain IMI 349063) TaxID=759273 RepID=H1W0G9_COLHI|nr:hypothetical protein CH063_14885 [Colletotrichum higginsianum]